jgi:hypothetical protein
MTDPVCQIRLNLPREALADERAAAGDTPEYLLGEEMPLPTDPDAVEVHFIEPVTLIATVTIAMLAWRIVNHFLVRDGRGVLIDMRDTPPNVSRLKDVPAGFVVLVKSDGSTETVAAGKADDKSLAELIAKALPAAG